MFEIALYYFNCVTFLPEMWKYKRVISEEIFQLYVLLFYLAERNVFSYTPKLREKSSITIKGTDSLLNTVI